MDYSWIFIDYREYNQSRRKQPGNELPRVLLVLYCKCMNAARRFATPQRRESDSNASEKYSQLALSFHKCPKIAKSMNSWIIHGLFIDFERLADWFLNQQKNWGVL